MKRQNSQPWWLDPSYFTVFITVPIFVISCQYAPETLASLRLPYNAIDDETFWVGLTSLFAFAVGAYIGGRLPRTSYRYKPIDAELLDSALRVLGFLTIASYLVFLSPVLSNQTLLLEFLRGSSDVRFRYILLRIPGITSLMQLGVVYASLYFQCKMNGYKLKSIHVRLLYLIIFFVFVRAILFSERLALIEIIVVFGVVFASQKMKPNFFRASLPAIGVISLFSIFSFFEFFRSWQFYKSYYADFFDFMVVRFSAYYVTSINNGAGIYQNMAPLGFPYVSGSWFHNFPLVNLLWPEVGKSTFLNIYLERLGSVEFNNPGGIYVLLFEYGYSLGLLMMAITGLCSGAVFAGYRAGRTFSTLLYPIWFVGILDVIRIYYWGETRFLPIVIASVVVSIFVKAKRNENRHFSSPL